MTPRSLLDILEPIAPWTQVDRIPGIDARCEAGLRESECTWPYCPCKYPDRPPYDPSDKEDK